MTNTSPGDVRNQKMDKGSKGFVLLHRYLYFSVSGHTQNSNIGKVNHPFHIFKIIVS